jgi:hypothetical protein
MTTAIVILIVILAFVVLSLLWDWRRSGRIFRAPIPRPYRDRTTSRWARSLNWHLGDGIDEKGADVGYIPLGYRNLDMCGLLAFAHAPSIKGNMTT